MIINTIEIKTKETIVSKKDRKVGVQKKSLRVFQTKKVVTSVKVNEP